MTATPLPASHAVGTLPGLKEPQLLAGPGGAVWLLWLEQRPLEKGRTTALIRPFGASDQTPTELTPAPRNLRSRVHDYGGGVLTAAVKDDQLLLVWIEAGCLWRQDWEFPDSTKLQQPQPRTTPARLSLPGEGELADGQLDLIHQRWIGIREVDGLDQLVWVPLDARDQKPQLLYQPTDFAGYACMSPDGQHLAWVEWQQPCMPWDSSTLWCADVDSDGALFKPRQLAGDKDISVFQPQWLPDGRLLVAEDSSGWWNLMVKHPDETSWQRPWPMAAETAMPQWVYGMSTTAWDGTGLLAAVCSRGSWTLKRLQADGEVVTIDQPFDDLAYLQACNGRAVAVASHSTCVAGLLEMDLRPASPLWEHTPAVSAPLPAEAISVAEPMWFNGHGGERTHAWYYPPMDGSSGAAPLMVKSHSGPTAMARRGLQLGIQYWTSRGWGVVDVNYGGSTGFGREYRERLNGGWGVVDVADCAAAAQALIHTGRANSDQIAIEGGSAGGFTTLAALCFTDVFRVGACRYAVCDLTAMAEETHRFEARYLDRLVGAWPAERALYDARSPLQHADQISCPTLFFQGLQDKVVPPQQTEHMAAALRSNGIPVEVRLFEDEGHGFRNQATQVQVLEATQVFFHRQLGLPIA